MLYRFLKVLIQITTRVFFRKIEVRNKSLIPSSGPMIICANHPSTFMDPIVIAAQIKRPIYFLSKGALFKSKIAASLLSALNMIPVHRQQDGPPKAGANEDTFIKCYEHLEKGGVIMIFPEGVSLTERKLKEIKTGAARIALGAEARNDFKLNVNVLCVGLNYQEPHKFNRDLFLNIEEPIDVSQYKVEYSNDTFKTAHSLTDKIRERMEKLIIDIEDEKTDELVHRIEEVYKPKLAKELVPEKQHDDFVITKNIVDTVTYFKNSDPSRVEHVSAMVSSYFRNLERIGLSDKQLNSKEPSRSLALNNLKSFFFIVFGFPVYVYGLINNFLPFEIPSQLAKKIAPDKEYEGPMAMAFGIFTFALFYTLQIMMIWKFSEDAVITLIYAFTLPVSGFAAYYYWHKVAEIRSGWKLINLFYTRSALVADLIQQRTAIIKEFDKARAEWRETISSPL